MQHLKMTFHLKLSAVKSFQYSQTGSGKKLQIDNAKDIGILILMYDLIECSCNHAKTTGFLW